jgi:hypothetical protein
MEKNEFHKKEEMIIYMPYHLGPRDIFNKNLDVIISERKDGKIIILLDYKNEEDDKKID